MKAYACEAEDWGMYHLSAGYLMCCAECTFPLSIHNNSGKVYTSEFACFPNAFFTFLPWSLLIAATDLLLWPNLATVKQITLQLPHSTELHFITYIHRRENYKVAVIDDDSIYTCISYSIFVIKATVADLRIKRSHIYWCMVDLEKAFWFNW